MLARIGKYLLVTALALGAGTRSFAADAEHTLDSRSTALAIQVVLTMHVSKDKMDAPLVRDIIRHILERLDPGRVYYTQKEADSLANVSDDAAKAMADKILGGNFASVDVLFDDFVKTRVARDKGFYEGLGKKADEIRKVAAGAPKYPMAKEWPATDDARHAKVLTVTAVFYNNYKTYLADEDAMKMAVQGARAVADRWTGELPADEMLVLFMQSFANSLDPHSNFFRPENSIASELSSSFVGVGLALKACPTGALVEEILPGGPAEKTGKFGPGDQIVAVDGKSVAGVALDKIVSMVKGDKDTEVRLTVLKAGGKKTEVIVVKRGVVDRAQSRVKGYTVQTAHGLVGVVSVESFYDGMTAEVNAKLREVAAKKIVGLVLDLRNNGGGYLNEAKGLIEAFTSEAGAVCGTRNSAGRIRWFDMAKHDPVYAGPVVVLVNQHSASASEITAGALKDYSRVVVVGHTHTFGKGSVQTSNMLLQALLPGEMDVTTELYFLPRGGSVQTRGVEPDITIPGEDVDPEEFESAYPNALPWDQIKGKLADDNKDAKKWGDWKGNNVRKLADKSAKRVEKNKPLKEMNADTAREARKDPSKDYQAIEAAEIAGDMSETWGK